MYEDILAKIKQRLDNKEAIRIIDVREVWEYDNGHIPTAINISMNHLHQVLDSYDFDDEIYIYCRSGQRASKACKKLSEWGFKNITNIGGIIYWKYETN